MKNNITELVFILDRSGSMAGLEGDTIGGFNALIQKQRKEEGECYVSIRTQTEIGITMDIPVTREERLTAESPNSLPKDSTDTRKSSMQEGAIP